MTNTPHDTCDLTHLNGELTHKEPHRPGTRFRCGGCGLTFPIVRHSEGHYDSPAWEAHAREMQHKNCGGQA